MNHAEELFTPDIESVHDAMTAQEAASILDRAAHRYLQMSGQEFVRKWRNGFFKGKRELASKVDAVSILLPLVER